MKSNSQTLGKMKLVLYKIVFKYRKCVSFSDDFLLTRKVKCCYEHDQMRYFQGSQRYTRYCKVSGFKSDHEIFKNLANKCPLTFTNILQTFSTDNFSHAFRWCTKRHQNLSKQTQYILLTSFIPYLSQFPYTPPRKLYSSGTCKDTSISSQFTG